MTPIQKMKAELKELAAFIRTDTKLHKEHHRKVAAYDTAHPDWKQDWRSQVYKDRCKVMHESPKYLGGDSRAFRLKHIVYCLARGRKYEEIEPKVLEENKLSDDLMAKLVAQAKAVQNEQETVCRRAS